MSSKQFIVNNSVDERYMVKLFIEVLKMLGQQGFDIIPYQGILDKERNNDYNTKVGYTSGTDYYTDSQVAYQLSLIFRAMTGIENSGNVRSPFNCIFQKKDGSNLSMLVYFLKSKNKSVSKEEIIAFQKVFGAISKIDKFSNLNAILITDNKLSSQAQSWLSEITKITHFLESQLIVSISENITASRRKILNSEELENFKRELDVPLSKIPSISIKKDINGLVNLFVNKYIIIMRHIGLPIIGIL